MSLSMTKLKLILTEKIGASLLLTGSVDGEKKTKSKLINNLINIHFNS